MKSITQNNENDKKVSSSILKFFKTYKISSILLNFQGPYCFIYVRSLSYLSKLINSCYISRN